MDKAEVLKRVEYLKNCAYSTTAVKVELEAELRRDEWGDCQEALWFIMDQLGVEESKKMVVNCGRDEHDHPYAESYNPSSEIAYMRFYEDGSVDSELTVTVKLDKAENVFILPKLIDAWNDLAEEIGNGMDIEGAGMHMALLNSSDCSYPTAISSEQKAKFRNFRKSMNLMIPALFFLGTHTEISRGLEYRRPDILTEGERTSIMAWRMDKYEAIWYAHGALEFRLFDTCYDKPEAILDNVVVIANCMKYWRKTFLNPGLTKITPSVRFGNDEDFTLKRFYKTPKQIDLLNVGLLRLKPAYYTIKQLKQQRQFDVSKSSLKRQLNQVADDARVAYKEYSERFDWELKWRKYREMARIIESMEGDIPIHQVEKLAAERAVNNIKDYEVENRVKETNFIERKVLSFQANISEGDFRLCVD